MSCSHHLTKTTAVRLTSHAHPLRSGMASVRFPAAATAHAALSTSAPAKEAQGTRQKAFTIKAMKMMSLATAPQSSAPK